MKFRALGHPLNWYQYEVNGSIEILDTYVADVEAQVERCVADFRRDAREVVVEGPHEGEPPTFITVHKGLDDETWDLQAIFIEYFPNLQRRSALITLFSFFEHEMNKLCSRIQATEKYQVSLKDLAGTGIERARSYLSKVALIELTEPQGPWNDVKNIQALRNLVVHADGRFPQDAPADRSAVRTYVEANKYLSGEQEVILHSGYLEHVLTTFDEYFKQVDRAIHRRYDA